MRNEARTTVPLAMPGSGLGERVPPPPTEHAWCKSRYCYWSYWSELDSARPRPSHTALPLTRRHEAKTRACLALVLWWLILLPVFGTLRASGNRCPRLRSSPQGGT